MNYDKITGPRYALVIATTSYREDFPALTAPAVDAELVQQLLSDQDICRFQVKTLVNEPYRETVQGVHDFLMERGGDDTVLVYISGHGVRDAGGNLYFIMTDTSEATLALTGIEARWLADRLAMSPSRKQIVILDCCYSGAFLKGAKAQSDASPADLTPSVFKPHSPGKYPTSARVVLTASLAAERAFEGTAIPDARIDGSIFTAGLVEGVRTGQADRDRDGFISIFDAFSYARDFVRNLGVRQTPQQRVDGGESEIWLAHNPSQMSGELASLLTLLDEDYPPDVRHGAVVSIGKWLLLKEGAQRDAAIQALRNVAARDPVELVASAAGTILGLAPKPPPRVSRLIRELDSHQDWCCAVAFNADGSVLASAADDLTIRLWEPNTGDLRRALSSQPAQRVKSMAFSPDGGTLALAGDRLEVWLLDEPISMVSRQSGPVNQVVFSNDGALLASAGNGVWLWDPMSLQQIRRLAGHRGQVHAVAFSPDSRCLVSGGADGEVRAYDLPLPSTSDRPQQTIDTGQGVVRAIAFSPDGRLMATGGEDGAVRLWRLGKTFEPSGILAGAVGAVTSVGFSPDRRVLAAAGADGIIRMWDVASQRVAFSFGENGESVRGLAFGPDRILAVASQNPLIRLWDVRGQLSE